MSAFLVAFLAFLAFLKKWKLLVNADGTGTELYDLGADLKETTNLAGQNPDIATRLTVQALAWRKSML